MNESIPLRPVWDTKRERDGEATNPGPVEQEANAEDQSGMLKEIVIRQVNITHLDNNGNHLLTQDCDILGIAEHKLDPAKMKSWKSRFREGRWKLTGSPADMTRSTPQAGVALATKTLHNAG